MKAGSGVLWDLDGVLVDTAEFHFESWRETFSELGVALSRERFITTFGMNNAMILEIILGEPPGAQLLAEVSERKERSFREAISGHARPLPAVEEWLDRLDRWGVDQAVASSAPQANIDVLVDELGIRKYFAALVSGADLPGKPDPAVFLEAARLIDVRPERCVVVEDAVAGVEAAKRGGMKCVAVTTTNPAHLLKSADVIVDRLDALSPKAFRRLLGLATG
jgi:HAD superfamily hydrolase (TIGR01509 family)